jgi:hypothetical protein
MVNATVTASEGIDLLAELGAPVTVRDARTVTLTVDGKRTIARVHVRRSAPSLWDIQRDIDVDRAGRVDPGIIIYVVPQATPALTRVASKDSRIAVVSVRDRVVILAGTRREGSLPGSLIVARNAGAPRRGRVAWGRFALLRALLRTHRSRTQIELAAECGVSQVAISHGLRVLGTAVVRDKSGWRAVRPEMLWEQFLTEYPGPQGITSYWLGLDPIVRQADAVIAATVELGCLVSGDTAADLIAPWRIGIKAVVYARTGVDLAGFGFAETTRANATLELVVPADPTIWATARAWSVSASPEMVDPALVAWDGQRIGGPDAAEAVARIQRTVLADWLS